MAGGAGSAITSVWRRTADPSPCCNLGIPDRFIEHGSREDCLAMAGLDFASLASAITRWWKSRPRAAS